MALEKTIQWLATPERLAWRADPVTQEFLLYLSQTEQEHMRNWARGSIDLSEHPTDYLRVDAANLGRVRLLHELQSVIMEPDQLEEETKPNEE